MTIHKRRTNFAFTALTAVSVVFLMPKGALAADELQVIMPVSITAVSRDEIEDMGLRDISDIANLSPSLTSDMGPSTDSNRLIIRGLAPSRFQENVGINIDGINISSQSLANPYGSLLSNPLMLGVESVDVIKGPQSALFGRNAGAGVISITTRDPAEEFEGHLRGEIGTKGRYLASGGVSGPVADGLSLGLDAGYWNERGFYRNSITGDRVGGGDGWGVSLVAKWEVTDTFSLRGRVSYSQDDLDQPAQARVAANSDIDVPANALSSLVVRCEPELATFAAGVPVPLGSTIGGPASDGNIFCDTPAHIFAGDVPDADDLRVTLSPDGRTGASGDMAGSERDILRLSLLADWDVGMGSIISRTGFTDADTETVADRDKFAIGDGIDGSGVDLSPITQILANDTSIQQFSQELSFVSDFDSSFNFAIGALYWDEEVDQDDNSLYIKSGGGLCVIAFSCAGGYDAVPATALVPSVLSANPDFGSRTSRDTTHWSVFGSARWDLTENMVLSGNLRYIDEKVKLSGPNVLVGSGAQSPFFVPPGEADVCSIGPCATADFGDPATYLITPAAQASYSHSESYLAYSGRFEWSDDDSSLHFSYSRGRTPGGFSTLALRTVGLGVDPDHNGSAGEIEFDNEKIDAYEIGGSLSTLDDTLSFGGAVFFQEIDNMVLVSQSVTIQPGDPLDPLDDSARLIDIIDNSGEAQIKGLELSAQWQPDDHFNFSAAYTLLDSEYEDYSFLSNNATEIAVAGSCDLTVLGNFVGDVTTCRLDHSGNDVAGVSKHALLLSASYTQPISNYGIDWFIGASGRYQGKRFVDAANTAWLAGHWVADLRVGIGSELWDLVFFADNLFNDETIRSAFNQPDAALSEHRVGVCVFDPINFLTGCQTVTGGLLDNGTISDANYPIATIANLPDPRTFGVRANLRF